VDFISLQLDSTGTLIVTIGVTSLTISLALIFKKELKQLLTKLRRVTIGGKVALVFGNELDQVPKDNPALDNMVTFAPAPNISPAPIHDPVAHSMNQLDGILREVLRRQGVEDYGSDVLPQSIHSLKDLRLISEGEANLIKQLYGIGERYRGYTEEKLWKRDAQNFHIYIQSLAGWMKKHIIPKIPTRKEPAAPIPAGKKPPTRRYTQVGGYGVFPAPAPGRPAAVLVATNGPLQGKRFPVDRERFHIGAGPENDLVIDGDEFVSERHALLRFQEASLFLFDADSRNGTYLNDRRITDSAMTLALGDHIRLGESTFRVEEADRIGASGSGQAGADSGRGEPIQGYVP
jgi:hypothetical protein